jgi:hypothetical protein
MNLGDWLMIPANFVGVVQRSLSYFGITWDKVSKSFVVTTFFTIWVCTTTVFEGMISAFNSVTQDLPEAIQAVNDTVNSESPDTSILAQVNYILPIDFLFSCLFLYFSLLVSLFVYRVLNEIFFCGVKAVFGSRV